MHPKVQVRLLAVLAAIIGIFVTVPSVTADAVPPYRQPQPCPHCQLNFHKPFLEAWMPAAFDKTTEYGTGYGGPVKVGYYWDSDPAAVTILTASSPLRRSFPTLKSNYALHVRVYVQRGVSYTYAGQTSNLWYPGCKAGIDGRVYDSRKASPAPSRRIGEYTMCSVYSHQAK